MSDVLEIRVKKSHVAVLSVVVLVASASAAVNVRDSMNVFGDLDMQGNKVLNATEYRFTGSFVREYDEDNDGKIGIVPDLAKAGQDFAKGELSLQKLQVVAEYYRTDKQISRGVKAAPLSEDGKIIASGAYTGIKGQEGAAQAGNFTFSSDINLQNNNIYNAANLNTGNGGGGGGSGDGYLPEKPATQDVDMNDHKIQNLADPVTDSEAATKGYVDAQTGGGGGGGGLEWGQLYQVSDSSSTQGGTVTASVSCDTGDVLVSATCEGNPKRFEPELVECDTRSRDEAAISQSGQVNDYIGAAVTGTCVPGG